METAGDLGRFFVTQDATMFAALGVIDANASGIAFVVDAGGRLQGVVTDGDIRRAILAGHSQETPVTVFMTAAPVTARADEPPSVILRRMSESVKYLPVVNDEQRVVDFAVLAHRAHLPVASPTFEGNELRYLAECIATGWISSQGNFVTEFEERFASFCDVRHAVAVCNGTLALHLALVLAGVGPGDEVIVPTLTFIATANAVRYTNADVVLVDSNPRTWTVDPEAIEAAITPRTRAVIPVHLYGHPVDMEPVLDLARRHDLFVIEDAAQAHGARYRGRRVGALGRVGCFSFFGNKIITTGEGGMLTTDDGPLAERARLLRDHGMSRTQKYRHDEVGFNYRLTNLQAAVGVAQMERIDGFLAQRARVAKWYVERLTTETRLALPARAAWADPVTWLFTVLLREGQDRDAVIEELSRRGVESRPAFHPVHSQPPYAGTGHFPVADALGARGLTLPTSVRMSEGDVERVCAALREVV